MENLEQWHMTKESTPLLPFIGIKLSSRCELQAAQLWHYLHQKTAAA